MKINREADLRWLHFPYNLYKARLLLEEMEPGNILAIQVDLSAIAELKGFLEKMGHKILPKSESATEGSVVLWVEKGSQ